MYKLLIKNLLYENVNITEFLNQIFNKKVYRFTYLGKCKLNKMPEYNFVLTEFNVMLDDFTNYTVFLKKFSKNKLEENLFCYWQFCEENFNLHGNFYLKKANIQNINYEKYNNNYKYTLQLLSKNNKIWKASDINIIELHQNKVQKNIQEYKGKLGVISQDIENDNSKEYLFIGII